MITSLQSPAGTVSFSTKKTLWLYFMLIPVCFIDFGQITAVTTSLVIGLTLLTVGLGHSIGLHRGVIHKSYKTSRVFRNISLYLFVLTGLGSPKSWLKQHYYRDYWQNRKDCPRYFRYQHSLWTDFIWNLHLQFHPNDMERYQIPKEDLNDPWIQWLNKTWYLHNIGLMLVIWLLFDFNTMLVTTFLRTSTIILGHWYIGYASHKFGYHWYKIKGADESGYNDVLLGLLSFGEGFHNNHHSHPSSAKFSLKWYEVDLAWYLVLLLEKLGIIYEVKRHATTLKPTAIMDEGVYWKRIFGLGKKQREHHLAK